MVLEQLLLWGVVVMLVHHLLWYVLSLFTKRMDIADIAWGTGIGGVGLWYILQMPYVSIESYLISIALLLWAVRLSVHIGVRAYHKGSEDPRYAAWRKDWGASTWFMSLLQVFLLQGVLAYLMTTVFAIYASTIGLSGAFSYVGIIVFAVGAFFEWKADSELSQFLKDPSRSGVLDTGLWSLSRHPNYFGEVVQWWGMWIMTYTGIYSLFGLVSPILITILILYVSGVPMSEERKKHDKAYQRYAKHTNRFFPWYPTT